MTNVRVRAGDLVVRKASKRWTDWTDFGVVVSERPTRIGWVEVLWSYGPCVMPGCDLELVTK